MSFKELAPIYFTRLREVMREVGETERLLNAGCGDGLYERSLKKKMKEIVSFDLNKGDVQIAHAINPAKNIAYCVGDIGDMPYKKDTFDCVICTEVLEHLVEERKAIEELIRVLKKNGKLIITVPSKDFPFFYDPINYILNSLGKRLNIGVWGWGHVRLYDAESLEIKIKLKMVKVKYLSFSLVGLLENSYLNSTIQKFIKNDPMNRDRVREDVTKIRRSVDYRLPRFFMKMRDLIMLLDGKLFSGTKKSIGIMVVFEK